MLYAICYMLYAIYYIGGWGGKSASDPNREIVFRVCVCVACVRASGGGGGARGIQVSRVWVRGAGPQTLGGEPHYNRRSRPRNRRSSPRSRDAQEDGWETARRQLGDS